ncbi:MAG: hypothetical protein SV377_02425 [Halobacteria archaeon]|nr:hypothetical protein [Halobacteria archaeon]
MDTVLLGTVVLFVLMNMVATIYFYTLREEEKTVGSIEPKTVEESNPKEDTTEVIECPHCGARNEFGYKYCQNCINELPGSYISSGSKNPITGGLSL